MSLKLLIFTTILALACAEMKLEVFDTIEASPVVDSAVEKFDAKTVNSITYFNGAVGQVLVGQAVNQIVPAGTQRLRLTFNGGAIAPNRVSQVIAYIDLPSSTRVISALAYTRQYERNFVGDFTLSNALTQNVLLSWYIWAV